MKKEFLIIDDDEITILLAEIILQDFPTFKNIKTFLDGEYALKYLQQEYSPDIQYIITLDINMPLLNGWEFLEAIGDFMSTNNTFVYMLSSSSDAEDIEKSKKIELVQDFIIKPLNHSHIKNIETRHL